MAIPIPGPLVEFVLLGPSDDRRQLQDSPILGDVWIGFGKRPGDPLELLIAPYRGEHAGEVAAKINDDLVKMGPRAIVIDETLDKTVERARISYLQGLVAAKLTFEELLRIVVPKTKWWIDKLAAADSALEVTVQVGRTRHRAA